MSTTRLVASRRGAINLEHVRVACAFPFGFISRVIHLQLPDQLVGVPRDRHA